MDHIRLAAETCVLRASAFAGLAIAVTMISLSFDMTLALRIGGGLTLAWSLFLIAWAFRLPFAPLRDNQVWIMLEHAHRPPKDLARGLIVPETQTILYGYAHRTASAAVLFSGLSLLSEL